MAKKALMLIDIQNGFICDNTRHIIPRLERLVGAFKQDLIIATQFINTVDSPFVRIMGWNAVKTSPETDLLPFVENAATDIIRKTIYSACSNEVMQLLAKNNTDTVYLAGIDTDACVLATSIGLFERGIRPIILEHYCASTGGGGAHDAGLAVMRRTIGRNQIFYGNYTTND